MKPNVRNNDLTFNSATNVLALTTSSEVTPKMLILFSLKAFFLLYTSSAIGTVEFTCKRIICYNVLSAPINSYQSSNILGSISNLMAVIIFFIKKKEEFIIHLYICSTKSLVSELKAVLVAFSFLCKLL